MIRIAGQTLTRLAGASMLAALVGAAAAAPVLVVKRGPQPDLSALAALDNLPALTTAKGLSVSRAFGEDDEDCLATRTGAGLVSISCAK